MRKLFFVTLLMISSSVYAKVLIGVLPSKNIFKQGEIIDVQLRVEYQNSKLSILKMADRNIGETIYFLQLNSKSTESEEKTFTGKAIFTKVPSSQQISETVEGEEVIVTWPEIEVVPVEEPKSFIYGDFTVPSPIKLTYWIIGLFGLGILLRYGVFLRRKRQQKLKKGIERSLLLTTLREANTYEDIVQVWQKKKIILNEFPQLESAFTNFESILFLYQFKPKRTDFELNEINHAYSKFKNTLTRIKFLECF